MAAAHVVHRIVCVRELTPVHMRGVSNGIVVLLAWVGMGLGGYQSGLFFDLSGAYVISCVNAAAASVINLIIVGSLYSFILRKIVSPERTTGA